MEELDIIICLKKETKTERISKKIIVKLIKSETLNLIK